MGWFLINKKMPLGIGTVIAGAGAVGLGVTLTPILLGFGTAGIAAGSAAAAIQSGIGAVQAGSLFATLQSLGMTGALTTGAVGSGITTVIGGIAALIP